jgi:hypothetical protein
MQKQLFILFILILTGCSTPNKVIKDVSTSNILELIVNSEHLYHLLALDKEIDVPRLRLIDLTNTFRRSEIITVTNKSIKNQWISILIYKKLKTNLNCGVYKDFVLYKVSQKKDIHSLSFFLPQS